MLQTNLVHIETGKELEKILTEKENVMVCCGRMGPMCIPVYFAMEELEDQYPQVTFCDMEFDTPEAQIIKMLPECRGFRGLPFTVYYKKGQVVAATTSIQSKEEIKAILDEKF